MGGGGGGGGWGEEGRGVASMHLSKHEFSICCTSGHIPESAHLSLPGALCSRKIN